MADTIRIAGLAKESIVDGPGLRLAVFTQGCPHHCPGCHNPHTFDFEGGYLIRVDELLSELDKNPLLRGITLSGGEPLARAGEILPLALGAIDRGKDIVCYTGYMFEELLDMLPEQAELEQLLSMVWLLIDGRYQAGLRSPGLPLRGSSNQRVLDMSASLEVRAAVEFVFPR